MPGLRRIPLFQVDAFTDRPFRGNPAAVCLPDKPLSPEDMQAIAREMNLSETAFPEPPDTEDVRRLRWFTPTTEVPLCGHATLATAHVLFGLGSKPPLRFRSASGPLEAGRTPDGRVRLDFPANPPEPADPPPGLLDTLEIPESPPALRSPVSWVIRLRDAEAVRDVSPDFRALQRVDPGPEALGVIVTAPGEEVDFVSRFFGPWVGVDEDPVTGVAHTVLGPYWARELGKETLTARQLSAREGEMEVAVAGERVALTGRAVTVVEGSVVVPGR